jgi:hypothetical protein
MLQLIMADLDDHTHGIAGAVKRARQGLRGGPTRG